MTEISTSSASLVVIESAEELRALFHNLRLARGMHQEELGHLVGYTTGAQRRISCVERGATDLNIARMLKWAEALNVEVLVRGAVEQPPGQALPTKRHVEESLVDGLNSMHLRVLRAVADALRTGLPAPQAQALETMAIAFKSSNDRPDG